MNARLFLPLALAVFAAGCSELDCQEVQPYHSARLGKPITAPEGLATPEKSGAYAIPGAVPGEDYRAGACLVRPPRVVPEDAPAPTG